MNKKLNKKIIFIPFYAQCPEHRQSASARIRAEWVAKYLPADIINEKTKSIELADYDFVIFQKCFSRKFIEIAKAIKQKNENTKIGLDLCDPVWKQREREEEVKEMIDVVDFITVPTFKLEEEIYKIFNILSFIIPDGHDLEYYKADQRKIHDKKIGIKYVWYGNSGTIKSLQAIMQYLEDVSIKNDSLTIIADPLARDIIKSKKLKIIFKEWKVDTVNDIVADCDISLNPKLNTKEYFFKSNNKTVMSYILCVPCIDKNVKDEKEWKNILIHLKNFTNRQNDVKIKRDVLIKNYRIETIVSIWKNFINLYN